MKKLTKKQQKILNEICPLIINHLDFVHAKQMEEVRVKKPKSTFYGYSYDMCNEKFEEGIEYVGRGATKYVFRILDLEGWVLKVDRFPNKFYCYKEARNYERALSNGYADWLVPSIYVMTIGKFSFSLQKEVVTENFESDFYDSVARDYFSEEDWEEVDEDEDEFPGKVENYIEDMSDEEVLTTIFVYHKELKSIEKFYDFCCDFNINDLHSGNFGYYNGKPSIFDYSGYYE